MTWQTADISHIPRLVEIACGADGELGTLVSMREATAGMLRVLHAICVAGERAEVGSSATCTVMTWCHVVLAEVQCILCEALSVTATGQGDCMRQAQAAEHPCIEAFCLARCS